MESSTVEPAAVEEGVVFQSEASNYRVVREPQRRVQIAETNEFEVRPGRTFEFYDGVLRVTDSDDIEWLRNYESYGKLYWEIGTEEDRSISAAELQKEIMEKALEGDFDRVADILVAERTGQSRPGIIAACVAALEAGEEDLPPAPDVPLHEQQRVRIGPAAGITPGVSPDPVVGSPQVEPSTLEEVPGTAGAPAPEEPAVPPGQQPALGETPEGVSATMPNAEGPEAPEGAEVADQAVAAAEAEPTEGEEPADGDSGAPGAPVDES